MKGLIFELSIPKYVLAKGIGGMYPKLHYGRGSCLSLRELASPTLPGPDWVRLRPLAVNPLLPCRLRGIQPPCKPCASGQENGCENTAEGCLAPGQMLGFQKDLPGGMSTEMVAHPSQLHPLPQGVGDKAGVLVGAAGLLERVDWTTVWRNELTLLGAYVYGPERFRDGRKHTFDLVLELLARREGPDPSMLVTTHTFPLARYQEAIEANLARGRHQSVKTVFDLRENP
ncbi:hypothetical protein [Vitiosangium sp. GDMCC 1.1324]|uniref:hypothetical protein n=1 Tax=Vitiosangium sp. (strain GDMCC 1.1324) TaxID=2138576 RepID=UPI000D397F78|nr:hypothetical protein [Vitiosangium sp. GDMCC 1.1324]PTL82621.1 hypothetical protein DAT35_17660 [Vitiosangium sp. GDMCC 1.1324]